MGAQIVEIAGQKMAVLPIADYERLLEVAEDKFDAAAAIAAEQRRVAGEDYVPADMVDRILAGESPLRAWRKYRDLNISALSAKAGMSVSYLSDIEKGIKRGSARHWVSLARALDVAVEDIMPTE